MRILWLALLLSPASVAVACPEGSTNEECVASFAKTMTEIARSVRTGRGPLTLHEVRAGENAVTLIYRAQFNQSDFTSLLVERGSTAHDFVDFVATDFIEYQCAGPLRAVQARGITVRNVITFENGADLGGFDLAPCPLKG